MNDWAEISPSGDLPACNQISCDENFMRAALRLARRGLGQTWPNPSVGCLLVKNGAVIARGFTGPGGRPHAEEIALRKAGDAASGATAYITLEPCAHSRSPAPCAKLLTNAGITRVVIACQDPDPRTLGKGIAILEAAGIAVKCNTLRNDAEALNQGYFLRIKHGRPLITLKLAASLDGRIAAADGSSRWITGLVSRCRAHYLRASFDAVLTTATTAIRDDATFTVRVSGLNHQPIRIVLDRRLHLPLIHPLVVTAGKIPTWLVTADDAAEDRRQAFAEAGVKIFTVPLGPDHYFCLTTVFSALGAAGLTRILVEAGGKLGASLIKANLVDELLWFTAPSLLGSDAVPAIGALGIGSITAQRRLIAQGREVLGKDEFHRFSLAID